MFGLTATRTAELVLAAQERSTEQRMNLRNLSDCLIKVVEGKETFDAAALDVAIRILRDADYHFMHTNTVSSFAMSQFPAETLMEELFKLISSKGLDVSMDGRIAIYVGNFTFLHNLHMHRKGEWEVYENGEDDIIDYSADFISARNVFLQKIGISANSD